MGERARRVYVVLGATSAAASTLAFAIATLYRLRTAGLDPFQLVLVGTVMEAAVFCFEVPTGIVADIFSRKLSIVIGHLGMGAAFVLEGSIANVGGVLAAQALWGVAYTFTSGATTAWIAGELGDPDASTLSALFLRASQWSSAVTVVCIPAAFALGETSLRTPLLVAGAVEVALGVWLALRMPEEHFERVPASERGTWHTMATTAREGFGAVRASRVLLLLMLVIAISGAASEAYDRYVTPHLLGPVGLPAAVGGSELFWLAAVATGSAALGIVVPRWVRRLEPSRTRRRLGRWVWSLYALHLVGLVVFALSGSIVVAIVAVLVIERARSVRFSLFGAWLVPLTPKAHRATVLSAMSQTDAIGQVALGPAFGYLGRAASIPTALVVSAGAMAPGLEVIRRAARVAVLPRQAAADPAGPRSAGTTEPAAGTTEPAAGTTEPAAEVTPTIPVTEPPGAREHRAGAAPATPPAPGAPPGFAAAGDA